MSFILVSGVQSLSSSVQSTPEKIGLSDDGSRSAEPLQVSLKLGQEKDLLYNCLEKEKQNSALSVCKMPDQGSKASKKTTKNQEVKKPLSAPNGQPSRKQSRKPKNPSRFPEATEKCAAKRSTSLICQNPACRATLSDEAFCKRCSCCICHSFDDNKDPSLWLECSSESSKGDSCGLSCHIECAVQQRKVGVVDLGLLMKLDGSYCCASCGKVSGILGCWKKQLLIAKDARRVDVLYFRISISYRLLDGTSRFKELHDIVASIKAKLDTELGPASGVSTKMARCIVSRLSVAGDVHALCSTAIEKADEWLAASLSADPNCREGSLPAACKVLFEKILSTSVVVLLIEMSTSSLEDIKGYKIWYCKTREETHSAEPACVFPKSQRRVLISNLLPCTEYSFRVVSFTEAGDMGHSEAKCFTKSVEVIRKTPSSVAVNNMKENFPVVADTNVGTECKTGAEAESNSGFQVRDLGKILQIASSQEQGCLNELPGERLQNFLGVEEPNPQHVPDQTQRVSCELDLNIASVPDLNEDLIPPVEPRDEDNVITLGRVEAVDDQVSHDNQRNDVEKSNGSGDSQNWSHKPNGDVTTVDSKGKMNKKRAATANEESHDCDSTLVNGSPCAIHNGSGSLGENFEYCVKIIRWLECEGHIKSEFRLKLLTWYSLRSTEQERRVVNTFIQTLVDDPSSLAGQLLDSFSDVVSSKKRRNGFCSKLWH
ncbi:VIN3-like protein 1 [Apium graveolens]|uniref:VIN3-like protein 1 n=1 Tax=Apium graveolens TaxID=4045 RepID=UPI003D7AACDC